MNTEETKKEETGEERETLIKETGENLKKMHGTVKLLRLNRQKDQKEFVVFLKQPSMMDMDFVMAQGEKAFVSTRVALFHQIVLRDMDGLVPLVTDGSPQFDISLAYGVSYFLERVMDGVTGELTDV